MPEAPRKSERPFLENDAVDTSSGDDDETMDDIALTERAPLARDQQWYKNMLYEFRNIDTAGPLYYDALPHQLDRDLEVNQRMRESNEPLLVPSDVEVIFVPEDSVPEWENVPRHVHSLFPLL